MVNGKWLISCLLKKKGGFMAINYVRVKRRIAVGATPGLSS